MCDVVAERVAALRAFLVVLIIVDRWLLPHDYYCRCLLSKKAAPIMQIIQHHS